MESTSQRTAPLLNMTGMEEEVLWYHEVQHGYKVRPHRARIVQQFLQQNNVDHLDWPARSPDLSPIEHVWDILGLRVRQRVPRPRTLQVGCRLAGGVEEETPATDYQTHQEYALLLCGLHRCNRWTYTILTDL